jgi:hypothetical protein
MAAGPEKISPSALTMSTWIVLICFAYCSVLAFSTASSMVPTM